MDREPPPVTVTAPGSGDRPPDPLDSAPTPSRRVPAAFVLLLLVVVVLGGQQAGRTFPALVAEGLDGPHAAPGQVLGDALQQHPAEAAAREVGMHVPGHEQDRVGADR